MRKILKVSGVMCIFLALALLLVGGVNAFQNPIGWFNVSSNSYCNTTCVIEGEYNSTTHNVTIETGAIIIVNNSQINMTNGEIVNTDGHYTNILINNSEIIGTKSSNYNRIYFYRYPNITIDSSKIRDIYSITFDSALGSVSTLVVNSIVSLTTDRLLNFNTYNNFIIKNVTVFNNTANECVKIRRSSNIIISGLSASNCGQTGVAAFAASMTTRDNNNNTFQEIMINNTKGHCISIKDANDTLVNNSVFQNCKNYAIDFYGFGNHNSITDNVVLNASDGVVFSQGEGGIGNSSNLTSRRNVVINVTTSGFTFNTLSGGLSELDKTTGAGVRGFSITTNVNNLNITNATIENCRINSVFISTNVSKVLIRNLTVRNANVTFYFTANVTEVSLKDSLINSNENHYGEIVRHSTGLVIYNLNFTNVLGWSFIMDNATNLGFNLTNNYSYFKATGSTPEQPKMYFLTNSLIYTSNGSTPCSTISTCNGNINITLQPNNWSYVLDNFNLTENTARENSPIWFSSSTATSKHIASNLSQAITATIIVPVDSQHSCGMLNRVSYTTNSGSTTTYVGSNARNLCSDGVITVTASIEPASSSNELELEYGCTTYEVIMYPIIRIVAALMILAFCVVYVFIRGGLNELTVIEMFALAVGIIVGIVFSGEIANILANRCSV